MGVEVALEWLLLPVNRMAPIKRLSSSYMLCLSLQFNLVHIYLGVSPINHRTSCINMHRLVLYSDSENNTFLDGHVHVK